MERFVAVRIVQANGMDLSLFEFDFDLTFAAFFMNADKTIYGRFGTRSSRQDAMRDISLEGFRKAMLAALRIHESYPANKASLSGKQRTGARFDVPEDYPSLRRYKRRIVFASKDVVKSCMHCHQIHNAEHELFRSAGKPVPEKVLFPWPMPDVVGLSLDSSEVARVAEVSPGSPAARGGFQPGDDILALQGQPTLSIADVQWVLHNTGDSQTLQAEVLRDGRKQKLTLVLGEHWRRGGDITWRTSTWGLRRMGTGGLVLKELSAADRLKAGLDDGGLALLVTGMGRYRPNDAAKRAGFKDEDIIVAFDNRTRRMSVSDLYAYVMQEKIPGDEVPVTVLRGTRRVELKLPMRK